MAKEAYGLMFKEPSDYPINCDGGQFGAPRYKRTHTGLDFLSRLEPIKASESGKVVYSGVRAGSTTKTNYGGTVIIDHTPCVPDNQRHIYSLYAHLDCRDVSEGNEVRQGETIGISGNTGTVAYYKNQNKGYHLHFEIIDTNSAGWSWSLNKENPIDYLGRETVVEYELEEVPEETW